MGLSWWYQGIHCRGPASSFHDMKMCWVTQMWISAGCSSSVSERSTEDFCLFWYSVCLVSIVELKESRVRTRLMFLLPMLPSKSWQTHYFPLPFSIIKNRNVVVKWTYLQKDKDLVLLISMLLDGGYCLHWSDRICIFQLVLFLVKKKIR